MTTSTPINKNYAICDKAIAIAKEELNHYSMVCIYQILTSNDICFRYNSNINNNTGNNNIQLDNDSYIFNSSKNIKKLRYSSDSMDTNYSSRFMSLSNHGHYLAISWLPNPRLGPNLSMKYCAIYDLRVLPYDDKVTKDKDTTPTLPCRLIEFYGGCSFTQDDKLVLINKDEVRVYSLQHNTSLNLDSFDLTFSLDIRSTNATLSPNYNYTSSVPLYFLFPISEDESGNLVEKQDNSVIVSHPSTYTHPADNFDDIFYNQDNTSDIEDDDEQQEKATFDIPAAQSNYNQHTTSQQQENDDEMSAPYTLYLDNVKFIKMNIKNIKNSSFISCIRPACHNSTSSDDNSKNQEHNIVLWSLIDRKIIHVKPIPHYYDADVEYITSFSQSRNLVAISKKYNPSTDISILPNNEPLFNIYDSNSGVIVSRLFLPFNRLVAGASQITFLQLDMYVMSVSYNYKECFFDIWDVASGIHLDSYVIDENSRICVENSQFVLHDALQLKNGCGVFLKVENRRPYNEPSCASDDYLYTSATNIYIQKIRFFESAYDHSCKCDSLIKLWRLSRSDHLRGMHTLNPKHTFDLESDRSRYAWPAFYLDKDERYLMTVTWKSTTGTTPAMTVWKVSMPGERGCRTDETGHKRIVKLEKVIYTFSYNTLVHAENIVGYPAILFNMTAIVTNWVARINPIIIFPSNAAEKIPLLMMQVNDDWDKREYGLHFEENRALSYKPYTLVIPLHDFSLLESRLHALANNEVIKSGSTWSNHYLYEDIANIPLVVTGSINMKTNWSTMFNMISENSEFFSTITGYSIICRLAKYDDYNDVLTNIYQVKTKVNYCSLSRIWYVNNEDLIIDPLKVALTSNAVLNAVTIIKHIKFSIVNYGIEYGTLLISNHQLIVETGLDLDSISPLVHSTGDSTTPLTQNTVDSSTS